MPTIHLRRALQLFTIDNEASGVESLTVPVSQRFWTVGPDGPPLSDSQGSHNQQSQAHDPYQQRILTLCWGSVLEMNGMSNMTASGELLCKKSRCSSVSGEKCPWTGMLKPNLKKAHLAALRCRLARRKHARKKSCTRC